jgi:hypothetical protein
MSKSLEAKIDALLAIVSTQEARIADLSAKVAAQPVREKDPFVLVFDTFTSAKSGKPYVVARLTEVATGEEQSFFVNGTFERDIAGGTRIGHYLKPMTGESPTRAEARLDREWDASRAKPAVNAKPEVDADVKF